MAMLAESHPGVRLTFNLTAPLCLQVLKIAEGSLIDGFREFLVKDSSDDREKALGFWNELPLSVRKKSPIARRFAEDCARGTVRKEDLTDFKVWLHLLCFHPILLKKEEEVSALFYKAVGFSDADRHTLFKREKDLSFLVAEKYRFLQDHELVELSTSPFYHPILPLLADSAISHHTETSLPLPEERFRRPEDVIAHIQRAKELYQHLFGRICSGMWPSEGSLSEEVLDLFVAEDIRWVGADNYLLSKSTGTSDFSFRYRWKESLTLLFRDRQISDKIGFVFQKMDEEAAARELYKELESLALGKDLLVPVILDGENPWDWYPEAGGVFLDTFYSLLEEKGGVRTITCSEACDLSFPDRALTSFFPGSWMGGHFDNWIGMPAANKAWKLLVAAGDLWEERKDDADPEAYHALLLAESSDWFWWMSLPADAATKRKFYGLFLAALRDFFRRLDHPVPEEEFAAFFEEIPSDILLHQPLGSITPKIDGRDSTFYEWKGSVEIETVKLWHTVQPTFLPVTKIYYGYDTDYFYLRLDFSSSFEGAVSLSFEEGSEHRVVLNGKPFTLQDTAFSEIFEWRIAKFFSEDSREIAFQVSLLHSNGTEMFRFPPDGSFTFVWKEFEEDWSA